MSHLAKARYGKDNIRLYKVMRNAETGVQEVADMMVCVMLEGDIDDS